MSNAAPANVRGGEASTSSEKFEKQLVFAQEDGDREWYRLANAIARGAGTGFCIKGGIHLLSWIFALVVKSRRKRLQEAPLRTLLEQALDTVRYTVFLGSLGGVYVGVDEGIANIFGRKRYDIPCKLVSACIFSSLSVVCTL